jgi:hypothetical protein
MKNRLFLLVSFVPLAVGVQLAPGPSEPVIVEFYHNAPMSVDLLSVRDSAIVVSLVPGLSDDSLSRWPKVIRVIPLGTVSRVRLEGSSRAATYSGWGASVGILLGVGCAAVSASEAGCERANKNLWSGTVGAGVVGCAIGYGIGLGIHDGSVSVTPPWRDLDSLRKLARYPAEEPPWLRERVR